MQLALRIHKEIKMFITIDGNTINTNHIVHAKDQGNGSTILVMTTGEKLTVPTAEMGHILQEDRKLDQPWKSAPGSV